MRVLRSGAALLVLVAGVAGVPYALVVLGGNPIPTGGARSLLGRLLRPDDGQLLVGLVVVVAWVAWSVFALSVLVELVNLVGTRGRRPGRIRLPGLAAPQHLAAGLLAAVAAAVLMPAVVMSPDQAGSSVAAADGPPDRPATTQPASPDPDETRTAGPTRPRPDADPVPAAAAPSGSRAERVPPGHLHVVERGDDLWSLAERFYGQGREWRRIAAANPDELSGGPDRLRVGVHLAIPGVPTPSTGGDRVVVREGDTLASLAEVAYDDANAWPTLYRANRHLIGDPDQIDVGLVLTVPAVVDPGADAPRNPTTSDADDSDAGTPDSGRDVSRRPGAGTRPSPDASGRAEPGGGDQPVPGQGAPTQGAPTQGAPTHAAPTQGAPTQGAPTQGAPTQAAPTQGAPTQAAPTQAAPNKAAPTQAAPTQAPAGTEPGVESGAAHPVAALGVGGLLAAGLIGGLLARRRLQLAARPVGRRILHPTAEAQHLEVAIGHRQQPIAVGTLDLVLRAVALHCHRTGRTLPELVAARVSPAEIELVLRVPDDQPPVGFVTTGRRWVVAADDVGYLSTLDGVERAPRAYPTLVTVGTDDAGRQILVELEQAGCFGYAGLDPTESAGLVLAMATELALAPWADELFVTLVGTGAELPDAAARHNLTSADDVDELLDRCERRAEVQRRHLTGRAARQLRIDPTLGDPWAPEVILVAEGLTSSQTARLRDLGTRTPRTTVAAVFPVVAPELTAGVVRRGGTGSATPTRSGSTVGRRAAETIPEAAVEVQLRPLGWELTLQQLRPNVRRDVIELLAVTGSEATTPAPWWQHEPDSDDTAVRAPGPHLVARPGPAGEQPTHPDGHPMPPTDPSTDPSTHPDGHPTPPTDPSTHPKDRPGRDRDRSTEPPSTPSAPAPPDLAARVTDPDPGTPGDAPTDSPSTVANVTLLVPVPRRAWANEEDAAVARLRADPTGSVHHPTVLLLGPLDLVGASGPAPSRATRQCLEYAAWLLEHPGSTAPAMAAGLGVAEGTRRSNVSRLRTWLGADADAEPYLPDAYSGRIFLHPAVSSDWQRLQILTATGINRTSTDGLVAALELVRGAPLADAAPGQWHWAEELRTDLASAVRDLGIELTDRALADRDLDLARWAASRALAAAPEDEQLLCARIRTEHQAGHVAEVERLVLRVSAQARILGVDLDPGTVILLQEVMEGRVRARLG